MSRRPRTAPRRPFPASQRGLSLLGLIVLHLLAVGFYAARKKNLVGPMITGKGALAEGVEAPVMAPFWRLLVGLVLGGGTFGILYWLNGQASAF